VTHNLSDRKGTGNAGEEAAARFLKKAGFRILGRNIARKTGEIDILAQKGDTLHFVEVKTLSCREFPDGDARGDCYDPADNLHPYKVRKVARTAEWLVAEREWEGEWQVDGALVWLRDDGASRVEHIQQIL
jgi:putative endonuclease